MCKKGEGNLFETDLKGEVGLKGGNNFGALVEDIILCDTAEHHDVVAYHVTHIFSLSSPLRRLGKQKKN